MRKHQKKITAVMLALTVTVSNLAVQSVNVEAATKKATSLKLNVTKKTLHVGETTTLKLKKVTPSKGNGKESRNGKNYSNQQKQQESKGCL